MWLRNKRCSINENFYTVLILILWYFIALETSDSGLYKCVASSRRGHSSWTASLTVSNATPDKNEKRGTPPGPPSRPHVVSSTNTSVTLAWRRNNKAGSSSLVGYQVTTMFVILSSLPFLYFHPMNNSPRITKFNSFSFSRWKCLVQKGMAGNL